MFNIFLRFVICVLIWFRKITRLVHLRLISGRRVGGRSGSRRRRESRRSSPYNHPPSRQALTRCWGEWNRMERNWAKGQGADMVWGFQVLGVELHYFFRGVFEILWVFPGIFLCSIAFPFDQILEFPSEHPTVQDLFHDIFLFSINEFQGQCNVLLLRAYPMGHFRSEPRTKTAHASDQTCLRPNGPCLRPNPHASDQHASDQCPMPQTMCLMPRSNVPWSNACLGAMARNSCGPLRPKRHILVPLCFSTLFLVIIVFIILSLSHCSSLLLFAYYYI